jgi:PadR family transcriptional regulator, regulatory protein AphA
MIAGSSQSQFALLGLLSLGPMSGYDLRQLIGWSVGYFWNEGYGQIYPTLNKLAADGLLERTSERKAGRPERHVYSLTEAGRERLRGWLRDAPRPEVPRNELLLKLFFGGLQPAAISREHILEHRRRHTELLRGFVEIRRRLDAGSGNEKQKPFWLITLSHGEHMSRASLAWCDETLNLLDAIEDRESSQADPRAATIAAAFGGAGSS